MRYREIKPTPFLRSFIECFWTLESDRSLELSAPERILPDGCVELILNFGDPFLQHVDGEKRRQPRNFVVGQMTAPVLISTTGVVRLLGIRFQPGGTRPFLDLPASEIADRVVDLGGLSSRFERSLLQACERAPALDQKVAAVGGYLVSGLKYGRLDRDLLRLAASVIDRRGLVSVDQLAFDAGLSSRQLERRFLREVGLGPKLLARIVRFQQVFRAVDQSNPAWADVAIECGYYDQAHLIRDFNQFAQQSPAVLFASQSALTESFTRKARQASMSHFSNTRA
jgi:AraC-like DNA-binding protein